MDGGTEDARNLHVATPTCATLSTGVLTRQRRLRVRLHAVASHEPLACFCSGLMDEFRGLLTSLIWSPAEAPVKRSADVKSKFRQVTSIKSFRENASAHPRISMEEEKAEKIDSRAMPLELRPYRATYNPKG